MTRFLAGLALVALAACTRSTPSTPSRSRASFAFDIRDAKGRPIPARITLVPIGGIPDLKLSKTDAGELRGRMLVAGNTELYQIVPIAITNPLFIDRDGDGRIRTTQL